MRFTCRVTRNYWYTGTVTVKASDPKEASIKALEAIDDHELKMGGIVEGSDEVHEIEPELNEYLVEDR